MPAAYAARVLGQVLPTLFLLSVAAFALTTAARGDPALLALQQDGQTPTPELLASYRVQLGLDDPLPVRYVRWVAAALHGDLGRSLLSNRPVSQLLGERILPTLLLAGSALVLSTLCGLLLGTALANAHGSITEFVGRAGLTLLASVPAFWLSITLIVLPRRTLAPVTSGRLRKLAAIDHARHGTRGGSRRGTGPPDSRLAARDSA
jgi:ABC-type dipeptide/oligopeptide/nickel transport system permease component